MREGISLPNNINFGCEVEFMCDHGYVRLNLSKLLHLSDFKFGYDCFPFRTKEAVSPIMNCDDLYKLKKTLEIIKRLNGSITGNEGAHIHFDHSIIEDDNLVKVLKIWVNSEDIIYTMARGEFTCMRGNYYAFARRLGPYMHDVIKAYDNGEVNLNDFQIFGKNHGLNLINHLTNEKNKDTYEVRVPNGTLNYEVWLNNIDFFGNFLIWANRFEDTELIDFNFNKKIQFEKDFIKNNIFDNDESKEYFVKQLEGGYFK